MCIWSIFNHNFSHLYISCYYLGLAVYRALQSENESARYLGVSGITIPVIVSDAMLNLKMRSPTNTTSKKYVKTISSWPPMPSPYPSECKLIENDATNVYTKQMTRRAERTSRSQITANQESGMMTYSANFPKMLNLKQSE